MGKTRSNTPLLWHNKQHSPSTWFTSVTQSSTSPSTTTNAQLSVNTTSTWPPQSLPLQSRCPSTLNSWLVRTRLPLQVALLSTLHAPKSSPTQLVPSPTSDASVTMMLVEL